MAGVPKAMCILPRTPRYTSQKNKDSWSKNTGTLQQIKKQMAEKGAQDPRGSLPQIAQELVTKTDGSGWNTWLYPPPNKTTHNPKKSRDKFFPLINKIKTQGLKANAIRRDGC